MPSGRWHRGPPPATQDLDQDGGPSSQGDVSPQVSTLERPRECINRFPTPAFSLLCTMMDRLRTEEASKRRNTLERFFELWRIKVGNDLYPLIRLLLPDVSALANTESSVWQTSNSADVCREIERGLFTISKKLCWPNATSRC